VGLTKMICKGLPHTNSPKPKYAWPSITATEQYFYLCKTSMREYQHSTHVPLKYISIYACCFAGRAGIKPKSPISLGLIVRA
jgi:hypothetical protein